MELKLSIMVNHMNHVYYKKHKHSFTCPAKQKDKIKRLQTVWLTHTATDTTVRRLLFKVSFRPKTKLMHSAPPTAPLASNPLMGHRGPLAAPLTAASSLSRDITACKQPVKQGELQSASSQALKWLSKICTPLQAHLLPFFFLGFSCFFSFHCSADALLEYTSLCLLLFRLN